MTQVFLIFHLGFPKPAKVYVVFYNSLPSFWLCVPLRFPCLESFCKFCGDWLWAVTFGAQPLHLQDWTVYSRIQELLPCQMVTLQHMYKARVVPKPSLGFLSWKGVGKGIFSRLCSIHKLRAKECQTIKLLAFLISV